MGLAYTHTSTDLNTNQALESEKTYISSSVNKKGRGVNLPTYLPPLVSRRVLPQYPGILSLKADVAHRSWAILGSSLVSHNSVPAFPVQEKPESG